jgi:hypothetical protein
MGRSLFDTASYDADTLKMLRQAFDDVWQEMTGKLSCPGDDRRPT